jgi:hypothetical protein
MATNFRSIARTLTYGALNGNVAGVNIYDHVPFEPEGAPANRFPYGVIGDAEASPFDNDSTLGAYVATTVHVWSRYKGRKQVDEALDVIYGLLHRATLTATGYNVVDCLFEFSDVFVESDGQTRHGVIRFQITLQEA